jgi:hypothetical protein
LSLSMRILRCIFLSILAFLAPSAFAQQTPEQPNTAPPGPNEHVTHLASPPQFAAPTAKAGNILPNSFAGWTIKGTPQFRKDPAAADPSNAALLREYGFTDLEIATYTRDDGRTLKIKAARFDDASGAYGAFTFYKTPEMLTQDIGDQAFSLNNRVLFFRGDTLVDVNFERLSMMSAAELRELASELPRAGGTSQNLPTLPNYLPKRGLNASTSNYIVGPVGLQQVHAPVPAQLVDFSKGAEVVTAEYSINATPSTLMLIGYPTPQIAAAQLDAIDKAKQAHQLSSDVTVRRTGPIVAVLASATTEQNAKVFLDQVNYDADITWNQDTGSSQRAVGHMMLGILMLAGILIVIAIVASIAFGGLRVLMQRLFPNRVFDRPEQIELIALHLSEPAEKSDDSGVKLTN